ncbi:MAG: hypothetical protein J07HR59_01166 [Halorubrum sp. J07HR59]|nr:MAG: hypothetical protein J07HR59_01166 [Halorubrum sp. J07HR59]
MGQTPGLPDNSGDPPKIRVSPKLCKVCAKFRKAIESDRQLAGTVLHRITLGFHVCECERTYIKRCVRRVPNGQRSVVVVFKLGQRFIGQQTCSVIKRRYVPRIPGSRVPAHRSD